MASISCLSDNSASSNPKVTVSFCRNNSRGEMFMEANSSSKYSRVGGVLRYSTTFGCSPEACMIAKVLRDVPQLGL